MNVNKKKFLILFLICLMFISYCSVVSAVSEPFNIANDKNNYDGVAEKDEYNTSLKYDLDGKLYYCTQPELDWPSSCRKSSTLNANLSGSITYMIRRYNDGKFTYSAIQKMISKLLYNNYSKQYRVDYDLSQALHVKNDNDVDDYYKVAKRVYNNNTKVKYYKEGTTKEISSLKFTADNRLTISYSLASPFELRCTANDGVDVTIDEDNQKITIDSNGKHLNESITLKCRTRYSYRKIMYYACTNQDIVRPAMDKTHSLYGSYKSISSTPPTYTIKYHGNSGKTDKGETLVTDIEGLKYNDKFNLRENMFVRPGYKFVGWRVYRSYDKTWYYKGIGWREKTYENDHLNGHILKKLYNPGGPYTMDFNFIKDKEGKLDIKSKIFYFYAQWEKVEGTQETILSIEKVNSSNEPILEKNVTFEIYKGSGCKTKHSSSPFQFNTGGDGIGMLTLEPGTYSIKETIPPPGYTADGQCIEVGNIANNENKTITVINSNGCEGDFELNQTISNRLNLYEKYPTYNNLLNFTITTASEACTPISYGLLGSDSCLTSIRKLENKEFNDIDLSAYNDTLNYNYKKHYCLTEFEINGNLDDTVTSGQFVSTNSILSSGTFTKTCYIHKDNITVPPNNLTTNEKLSDYVGKAKLEDKILPDNYSDVGTIIIYNNQGLVGEFYKYEATYDIEIYPLDVYATIGSGEIEYDDCPSCEYLGKGIISNFSPTSEDVQINFSMETPLNNKLNLGQTSTCSYKSVPEITIENKLQLEFRVIDTNIPFERDTNSNWCNEGDCSMNNSLVESVIKSPTANNSTNKTKEGSLYTNQIGSKEIILTPELIKSIREYNRQNPYDDYEKLIKEETENGIVFKSKFLEQFNIIKTG